MKHLLTKDTKDVLFVIGLFAMSALLTFGVLGYILKENHRQTTEYKTKLCEIKGGEYWYDGNAHQCLFPLKEK